MVGEFVSPKSVGKFDNSDGALDVVGDRVSPNFVGLFEGSKDAEGAAVFPLLGDNVTSFVGTTLGEILSDNDGELDVVGEEVSPNFVGLFEGSTDAEGLELLSGLGKIVSPNFVGTPEGSIL